MQVSLIPDAGSLAAQPEDFFRSPEFFEAEGVSHSLAFGPDGPVTPVLVREVPGSTEIDAISPYGYPGARAGVGGSVDPVDLDWSGTGLVSVFIRDAIGVEPFIRGGTERSNVCVCDPAAPSGMRKRLREQIRRNERNGWSVELTSGPQVSPELLEGFSRAYSETMVRTGATDRYLFEDSYFETLFRSETSWLVSASHREELLAGAIVVASDGLLHYFLGGTAADGLDDSPMKNLFGRMIDLSEALGLPLNLGGGLEPGDSLESFKRGFSNAELPFITHEIVCDSVLYESLSGGASPAPGFFPAYRSST